MIHPIARAARLALGLACAPALCTAQAYPSKSVRIIVPYQPIPNMGAFGIFIDPDGAPLGLFEAAAAAPAPAPAKKKPAAPAKKKPAAKKAAAKKKR